MHKSLKRYTDVGLSFMGIIFSFPIVFLYSFLVIIINKTNPVFIQKRSIDGENYFSIYKLRTLGKESVTKIISNKGIKRKLAKGDYLIFGKLLRKSGLDELPQLINVIKGEMSLIGPRPLMQEDIEMLKENNFNVFNNRRELKSKPGISGMWQLHRNRNLDYDELLRYDKFYEENESIKLEIEIIVKTIQKMLTFSLSDSIKLVTDEILY